MSNLAQRSPKEWTLAHRHAASRKSRNRLCVAVLTRPTAPLPGGGSLEAAAQSKR
jgi:hypothetical protein